MGWTYTDLDRCRMTLEQAKERHVWEATRYGDTVSARIVIHEWKNDAWFAVIRLEYLEGHEKHGQPVKYFLRTDMIDISGRHFGYKDMTEAMGPHITARLSVGMKAAIAKYIPFPPSEYALDWRKQNGIPYQDANQLNLFA